MAEKIHMMNRHVVEQRVGESPRPPSVNSGCANTIRTCLTAPSSRMAAGVAPDPPARAIVLIDANNDIGPTRERHEVLQLGATRNQRLLTQHGNPAFDSVRYGCECMPTGRVMMTASRSVPAMTSA